MGSYKGLEDEGWDGGTIVDGCDVDPLGDRAGGDGPFTQFLTHLTILSVATFSSSLTLYT